MNKFILIIAFLLSLNLSYSQDMKYFIKEANALSSGRGQVFYNRKVYLDSAFQIISKGRELYDNSEISSLFINILEQRKHLYYTRNSPIDTMNKYLEEVKILVDQYPKDIPLYNVEYKTSIFILKKSISADKPLEYIITNIYERSESRMDPFEDFVQLIIDLSNSKANILTEAWIESQVKVSNTTTTQFSISILNRLMNKSVDEKLKTIYNSVKTVYPNEQIIQDFQYEIENKILDSYSNKKPTIESFVEFEYYIDMYPTSSSLLDFYKSWALKLTNEYLDSKAWSKAGMVFSIAKKRLPNDIDLLKNKKKWVISDYNENYLKSAVNTSELNWTGSVENCSPGKVSDISSTKVVQRLNYFRRIAGLPDDVLYDSSLSNMCQHTSLIMSVQGKLSHYPSEDWKCFSEIGAVGARESNLSIGCHSSEALTGMMEDSGDNNKIVGHRGHIINYRLDAVGYGSTNNSMTLNVFGSRIYDANSLQSKYEPEYIIWPPAGYVPNNIIFPRWSFELHGEYLADVKIQMTQNGKPLKLNICAKENNKIVWEPQMLDSTTSEATYVVIITMNSTNKNETKLFEYTVIGIEVE